MRSQKKSTSSALKEAKREVRKIVAEVKAVGKRLEPIRDAIPLPSEPMRTLMEAGYVPRDEAQLLWDDLDYAVRNFEDSDIFGAGIDWLEDAIDWSSHQRRERLFAENHDTGGDPSLGPLSLEEGLKIAKKDEPPRSATWRLGLTLGRMDPAEDVDAFLDALCTVASLKTRQTAESIKFSITQALLEGRSAFAHYDSAKRAAASLEAVLASLVDHRDKPQYAKLETSLRALRQMEDASVELSKRLGS